MRSRSLYNNGFILNLALGYISEPTWHTSPEKQDCFCFCECTSLSMEIKRQNEPQL
nr:MAG TPA: hypothetical protein [Siphoviridae sp. ctYIp7]